MEATTTATGLVQTWVSMTDSDGRTRLEAHWIDASAPAGQHVIHAA